MKKLGMMVLVGIFLLGMVFFSGCRPSLSVPQTVLRARDWGIEKARQEGIEIPENANWMAENITPPLLVGYVTYAFTYGNFCIEVGYPVVLVPAYTVTIYENNTPVWVGIIGEPDLP